MENPVEDSSPTVFVSLAQNDPELAHAAIEGGADGLKIHLNVTHRASGTEFGDVDEEGSVLREIGALDVPVGVVPGQDLATVRETVPKLDEFPIDFVDAYAHHHPPDIRSLTDHAIWTASPAGYDREEILALGQYGLDALELSIQPKSNYGDPASMRDVARYAALAEAVDTPVVIPSQLALTPADAVELAERGVTNFLLGAVVTDHTPDSVRNTVEAFVTALDDR